MTAAESGRGGAPALNARDARVLTEYMSVLPDQRRGRGADDLYLVVTESGREYLVDTRTGARVSVPTTSTGATRFLSYSVGIGGALWRRGRRI